MSVRVCVHGVSFARDDGACREHTHTQHPTTLHLDFSQTMRLELVEDWDSEEEKEANAGTGDFSGWGRVSDEEFEGGRKVRRPFADTFAEFLAKNARLLHYMFTVCCGITMLLTPDRILAVSITILYLGFSMQFLMPQEGRAWICGLMTFYLGLLVVLDEDFGQRRTHDLQN